MPFFGKKRTGLGVKPCTTISLEVGHCNNFSNQKGSMETLNWNLKFARLFVRRFSLKSLFLWHSVFGIDE